MWWGERGYRGEGGEGERQRQLFNASAGKENEVAVEFSFYRDISPPLAPLPALSGVPHIRGVGELMGNCKRHGG